jgi:hypothetical protein
MTSTTTPLPEDNDEIINEQTIELTTEDKWSYEPSSLNPILEFFFCWTPLGLLKIRSVQKMDSMSVIYTCYIK